jgi:hypothetical protein
MPAVAAGPAGGLPLNTTRILVVALLLVPALVVATPVASAAACNPHFTGDPEIDGPEYQACTTGLGLINRICHNCIA